MRAVAAVPILRPFGFMIVMGLGMFGLLSLASAPPALADALLEFSHGWQAAEIARPLAADAPTANSRGPPPIL